MKNEFIAIAAIVANNVLATTSGADIRDEVGAWVTLIGSIAITITTIGIQIYHLIRDRDRDKHKNTDAENTAEKEDKDGKIH